MYNQKKLSAEFSAWDKHLNEQKLPTWDELPDLELYMDQVLILINRYTNIFNPTGQAPAVTPPMINNYVKQKTIPAPNNKKYGRVHLAYLIMVCTLKQALTIATIEKMIPFGLEEEKVKDIYNSFAENQRKAFSYVSEQVSRVAEPILTEEGINPLRMQDLILQVAITANIFKTLTDHITELSVPTPKSEETQKK
ncbi:MAG: DUF1836 domain-containing protein [Clostridia bacterium]|nr:DUF1836 domain-containing protein [Clostridia bacterium]